MAPDPKADDERETAATAVASAASAVEALPSSAGQERALEHLDAALAALSPAT